MNEFEQIFTNNISRDGAQALLAYLRNSDFFTAPASAKFHLAEKGGLMQHSVNVYKRLVSIVNQENMQVSQESLAICGLLHDICKVRYYVEDTRNVKENGQWVKKPYYSVKETFPFGHGEKSVFLIQQFMKLEPAEAIAINWHMGGFDQRVKGGSYSASDAYEKYPLALLLHIADMQASYLDEPRGAK